MASSDDKVKQAVAQFAEWLRDPFHMRIFVAGVILVAGYGLTSWMLGGEVLAVQRQLSMEKIHLEYASEIDHLKTQIELFEKRLPKKSDPNEWAQYILSKISELPLELSNFKPAEPKRLGPYQLLKIRIEVRGRFKDMAKLVRWLETNDRLFRIDSMTCSVPVGSRGLQMNLTVLGLMK